MKIKFKISLKLSHNIVSNINLIIDNYVTEGNKVKKKDLLI
jgi:hypothetical protein